MNSDESTEYAKEFLEDVLSFFGVNVIVDAAIADDVIELDVPATEESSILIGKNAETLAAFQSIVSSTLRSKGVDRPRLNIDIAGYKKQHAEKLAEKARGWIEEVRKTGDSYIANLNAADRRIVHQVAAEYSDINTHSEGEGRDRKIIIAQASS